MSPCQPARETHGGKGQKMAEAQGFEPWRPLRAWRCSRPLQSTALPNLRIVCRTLSVKERQQVGVHKTDMKQGDVVGPEGLEPPTKAL